MASSKGGKNSREERLRKSRLIISVIVVAALIIFYLADPAGFHHAVSNLMDDEPVAAASPAASPAASASPADTGSAGQTAAKTAEPGKTLEVYFIDVGQGDCIFMRSPNGKTMLIDTGEKSCFDTVAGFLDAQGVTELDAVVETHPHSDHMGGMAQIVEQYDIGVFYASPATNNTAAFEKMLDALEEKNVDTVSVYADEISSLDWDEDVTVRVLSPFTGEDYDLNNFSIVLNVIYGDTSVLLTGDAEEEAESVMLEKLPASYFKATILKLGHHGSSTSTSAAFFQAVSPKAAVICVGADNDYGHPHAETLAMLKEWGGPVYRTDLNGTIHFTLDGSGYAVDTEK